MFYSNLLKGVVIVAMAAVFTSCVVKTKKISNCENTSQEVVTSITESSNNNEPQSVVVEESQSVEYVEQKESKEWDSLLNDYEEYIDTYISCLKKASGGDLSAMSEMATLLEKTEKNGEHI